VEKGGQSTALSKTNVNGSKGGEDQKKEKTGRQNTSQSGRWKMITKITEKRSLVTKQNQEKVLKPLEVKKRLGGTRRRVSSKPIPIKGGEKNMERNGRTAVLQEKTWVKNKGEKGEK